MYEISLSLYPFLASATSLQESLPLALLVHQQRYICLGETL